MKPGETSGRTIGAGEPVDDHPLIMAVASYASKPAAECDFGGMCDVSHMSRGPVAVAVLEKGADGSLTMQRHHSPAAGPTRGGQLLGAALVVLAAPLGLRFLASVIATRETWLAVAQVAARFWENVPRSELHRMGTLLEARQAALVVVSVNGTTPEVGQLLRNSTACIVTDV
jgi:hypothetical protein